MKTRRLPLPRLRWALLILALLALLPVALGLYIYEYGQADRATSADVIIILGAGTRPNGAPTAAYTRRIRHGVALYNAGLAPYVLCTGGYTDRHPTSEARACVNLARDLGVPDRAILFEEISRSTEENAIEARRVMDERRLRTAILVSDNFHLLRAEWIFRDQGILVALSPAQATVGPLYWRTAVSNTAREVAALGWYAIKGVLGLPYTNL
ncbi:MAG: YdcF family protein [Anaerolineae bacterium]|nr:YdcF family protein [Anaerolineae bacterium]